MGSRLGKKGRLCRKTFVRLLCLTAAMMVLDLLPPLPEREVLPAAEAAEVVEVVLPIIIQAGRPGTRRTAGAFQALLLTGTFVILGSAGTITYLHRAKKKQAAAREKLKEFPSEKIIGIGVRYRSGCGNHITGFRNAGGIEIWKKGILT